MFGLKNMTINLNLRSAIKDAQSNFKHTGNPFRNNRIPNNNWHNRPDYFKKKNDIHFEEPKNSIIIIKTNNIESDFTEIFDLGKKED